LNTSKQFNLPVNHFIQAMKEKDYDFDYSRDISPQILVHAIDIAGSLSECYGITDINLPPIIDSLKWFYSTKWNHLTALCPSLITSTLLEIGQGCSINFNSIPEISYVVPVFKPNEDSLSETLVSIKHQIGVLVKIIIILDGEEAKAEEMVRRLIERHDLSGSTKFLIKPVRSGVAKARNTGMKMVQTEFFSWLDAHDIIHPLRSLHSILLMLTNDSDRVNTLYARFESTSKKIMLANLKAELEGPHSFISKTDLLNQYGYLKDRPRHEDTEYLNRLNYFNLPMINDTVVAHFCELNANAGKGDHLSDDLRSDIHTFITNCDIGGAYKASSTVSRLTQDDKDQQYYRKLQSELAYKYFPCSE